MTALKFYFLGSGVTIAKGEIADAHISPSRKVTIYSSDLSFSEKQQIYHYAMYENPTSSESQEYMLVFDTPTIDEQAKAWCRENGFSEGSYEGLWSSICNGVETMVLLGEVTYLYESTHGARVREIVYSLSHKLIS